MKKALSIVLTACLLLGILPLSVPASAATLTEEEVYQRIIEMKSQYPDGTPWSNSNSYVWKIPDEHGYKVTGNGCAGFAFLLSDAAFGTLPVRKLTDFKYEDVKVGNILRLNGDSHSVVVLKVNSDGVNIAEGNFTYYGKYNNQPVVYWNRTLTKNEVLNSDYMYDRYPTEDSSSSTPTATPEPTPTPVAGFQDVSSSAWYAESVEYAVDRGIIRGETPTRFNPEGSTNRAMLVTILYRMEGEPAVSSGGTGFSDVSLNQYYTDAVKWAASNGIVMGHNGKYNPTGILTRQDFATMLYRYAEYKNYDYTQTADLSGFRDAGKISSYAKDAMSWANAVGLVTGTNPTTIDPLGTATRAQAATLYQRFNEKVAVTTAPPSVGWREAYRSIIQNAENEEFSAPNLKIPVVETIGTPSYAIADINFDGTPELALMVSFNGGVQGNVAYRFYTYKNGSAQFVADYDANVRSNFGLDVTNKRLLLSMGSYSGYFETYQATVKLGTFDLKKVDSYRLGETPKVPFNGFYWTTISDLSALNNA